LEQVWAGVDIGKSHHHTVVIDGDGRRLLSRRVANDEAALRSLIDEVRRLADRVIWAVDIVDGAAALLLALLVGEQQQVLYLSSTKVNRAAGGYRGEGKTDARDAAVIADQARMRRDLQPVRIDDELIVELRMLVARRQDLVADRTRMINRLRAQLLAVCPALERALDVTNTGPLILLSSYQRPHDLVQLGTAALEQWLRARKVRGAAGLAERAVRAAASQTTVLPGEQLAAVLVAQLAQGVMSLNEQVSEIDALIEDRFHRHKLAAVIDSMPGIGVLLGAEFLAATGGDINTFRSADHLAAYAGLAPTPRDSGRVSGNLHRPRRYSRPLNRALYMSALVSIRTNPESKRFYDRKRSEGKGHTQAVLALARRRVNVLWALLRDKRPYAATPPRTSAA
jgi:transposase